MNQASWHLTDKLEEPATTSIITLPAKCPEFNPVENFWQYMRNHWLSNRAFISHQNTIDHYREAWNKLIDTGASCPSADDKGRLSCNQFRLITPLSSDAVGSMILPEGLPQCSEHARSKSNSHCLQAN
jgi:DDE superfamily endonuclease